MTSTSSDITNTLTETAFSNGAWTPSANWGVTGEIVTIVAFGTYDTTGAPSLTFNLRYGSTNSSTLLANGATVTTGSGASGNHWYLTITLIVRSAGGSGTVITDGIGALTTGALGISDTAFHSNVSTGTVVIDTTATTPLTLFAKWGSVSTSDKVRLTGMYVTTVN